MSSGIKRKAESVEEERKIPKTEGEESSVAVDSGSSMLAGSSSSGQWPVPSSSRAELLAELGLGRGAPQEERECPETDDEESSMAVDAESSASPGSNSSQWGTMASGSGRRAQLLAELGLGRGAGEPPRERGADRECPKNDDEKSSMAVDGESSTSAGSSSRWGRITSRSRAELLAELGLGRGARVGAERPPRERIPRDASPEGGAVSRGLSDMLLDLSRGRRINIRDLTSEELEATLPPCMCRLASLPLEDMHNSTAGDARSNNNQSPNQDVDTEFDWVWDNKTGAKSCIELSADRTEVRFHTNYSLGTASARSNLPLVSGQNYWEIKMVSAVYGTDMMVGLGTGRVDPLKYTNQFCSMLGMDTQQESCGLSYLGDFYYGGQKTPFCSRFGLGTVIGVHLDLWTGTVSYYKNGVYLGVACRGLKGREWYPMVCSTAAKSSMCLIRTASFQSSLQYLCCRTLRQAIPGEMDVLSVTDMPPGLKKFLRNNLYWLLGGQSGLEKDGRTRTQGTQTSKRRTSLELSIRKLGERR